MQQQIIKSCACIFGVLTAAVGARAQVTFELAPVTIPTGTSIVDGIEYPGGTPGAVLGNLDGYVSQDLTVDTDIDWTAAAVLVDLSSGSIYQENEGIFPIPGGYKFYNGQTSRVPISSMFSALPSSEYDTYVHGNGDDANLVGAGGDVGGDSFQFDATELDASWSGPTSSTDDTGTVALGRFTFTNDAAGIWRIMITQSGENGGIVVTGTFSNGVMAFDP